MVRRFAPLALAIASFSMLVAGETQAAAPGLAASIEVATPPSAYGTDAAALHAVAAEELRNLAPVSTARRRVVVSLALAPLAEGSMECEVDATLRDERTGAVIAVIESVARATTRLSPKQRKDLAFATVRRTVRRVPSALAGVK